MSKFFLKETLKKSHSVIVLVRLEKKVCNLLPEVEQLRHEVHNRLSFVEGGGGHVNVEGHLPVGGPHRLVEAKPNLPAAAQGVVIVGGRGEEGTPHGGVQHARLVPQHHVCTKQKNYEAVLNAKDCRAFSKCFSVLCGLVFFKYTKTILRNYLERRFQNIRILSCG